MRAKKKLQSLVSAASNISINVELRVMRVVWYLGSAELFSSPEGPVVTLGAIRFNIKPFCVLPT